MANISLTTYVNIPQKAERIDLIPSVAIPGGKTPPTNCVLGMYGTKDSLAMLKEVRMENQTSKLDTFRVDLIVPVGEQVASKSSLEDLKTTCFLNLKRLKAETAEHLLDIVCTPETKRFVGTKSGVIDLANLIGEHPALIDHIWNDPQFSHLKVIVWPAPVPGKTLFSGEPQTVQMAAIRPEAIEEVIVRNFVGEYKEAHIETTAASPA